MNHSETHTASFPDLHLRLEGSNPKTFSFSDKQEIIIGRTSSRGQTVADLGLDDAFVSKRHCRIFFKDGIWQVEDLQSRNRTQLNGDFIDEPRPLDHEDLLRVGDSILKVFFREPGTLTRDPEKTPHLGQIPFSIHGTEKSFTRRMPGTDDEEQADETQTRIQDRTTRENDRRSGDGRDSQNRRSSTRGPFPKNLLTRQLIEELMNQLEIASSIPITVRQKVLEAVRKEGPGILFRVLLQEGQNWRPRLSIVYTILAGKLVAELLLAPGKTSPGTDFRELNLDDIELPEWFSVKQIHGMAALPLHSEEKAPFRYVTTDPFDQVLRHWFARQAGKEAKPVWMTPGDFQELLNNQEFVEKIKSKVAESGDSQEILQIIEETPRKARTDMAGDADISKVCTFFLFQAWTSNASDIHIEPTEGRLLIRFRVHGTLGKDFDHPMELHPPITSFLKIRSGMNVAERRRPQDGRFTLDIRGAQVDVRVSSYPTIYGEKLVLRLLNKMVPNIDSLKLLGRDDMLLREKIFAPNGLILISGPTGSGKTTTLYACLNAIDRSTKNVLTVEDPVEYRMEGVHQMQVNAKIGVTFATGLRTILRQDPDIIMVGEIRDPETAQMAVQASLTGHLVLSTIHANNAAKVITRLLNMGSEPFLVANSLSLVIAQRLVRELCDCRKPVNGAKCLESLGKIGVTPLQLQRLKIDIHDDEECLIAVGCPQCRDTGYKGRQPVFEVLNMTDEVRQWVNSPDKDTHKLEQALIRSNSMTPLLQSGLRLVEEGVTTYEEVIRVLGEE